MIRITTRPLERRFCIFLFFFSGGDGGQVRERERRGRAFFFEKQWPKKKKKEQRCFFPLRRRARGLSSIAEAQKDARRASVRVIRFWIRRKYGDENKGGKKSMALSPLADQWSLSRSFVLSSFSLLLLCCSNKLTANAPRSRSSIISRGR